MQIEHEIHAARVLLPIGIALALCLAPTARAAPRVAVNGKPACGSFAVTWLPEDLRQAQATGINLVYCYDKRASAQLLDPETELGGIALEGDTKVMANFLRYAHGSRLASNAGPADTELQIVGAKGLPDSGTLWIDDEAVAYSERDDTGVRGAERGAQGTTAAAHGAGTHLLEEGTLRDDMDRYKDSPNLWGFWVLDDKKGNHLPALRNLYRLIRKYDVDDAGRALNHVVVAGFGSIDSLTNFGERVCDAAGLYLYPSRRGTYHVREPDSLLREMIPTIRERDPGVALIGIYQAFHGPRWEPKPTPLQIRQQIDDFLRWGASGVMAYSWRMVEGNNSLWNLRGLREEVGRIANDLREGRLTVDRTPPEAEPRPEVQVVADHLVPLLTFGPDMQLPQSSPGLAASLGPPQGALDPWLRLDFEKYSEGGNEWPGLAFDRSDGAFEIADWSPFAALVVRVANQLDTDSDIGITIHGPDGMWARYFPLPAGPTLDVVVDLAEARDSTPVSQVRRLGLLMRRPAVATRLEIEGMYLMPMQFETRNLPVAEVPRSGAPVVVDGVPEAAWDEALELPMTDGLGEPPLKPCTAKLLHDRRNLFVLFECAAPDLEQVKATTTQSDSPMPGEDLLEILIRSKGHGQTVRLLLNAKGALRDEALIQAGPDLAWSFGAEARSTLANGRWTVEFALPLDALGASGDGMWEANFRRVDTELRSLAWLADTKPGYELLRPLRLSD